MHRSTLLLAILLSYLMSNTLAMVLNVENSGESAIRILLT